jgi:two-component system, NtrC family, sensor kinase
MGDGRKTILGPIVEKSGGVGGPLFRKYVGLFLAVVCIALLSNSLFEIMLSYGEHRDAVTRLQREQAEGAAERIGHFIEDIESQAAWTTQLPWSDGSIEQRRFDALRLLRQVPAITEVSQLDPTGKEQLHASRLDMEVLASGVDYSHDPKFTEATPNKVYYGPVYFRRESEPYMTMSVAGNRPDAGVTVAEVNLKFIWDVVSQIKVGDRGQAYVVDAGGRLIAHPDIRLVLRDTDMSKLIQVQAARTLGAESVQEAQNIDGMKVLTAYAPVRPPGWLVFVDLPVEEAFAPLYQSIRRSIAILVAGLILAFLAGLFLARRMVVPIQILRAGAQRIGRGDLGERISIKTGDELEGLADQFNDMADRLQKAHESEKRYQEGRLQLAHANRVATMGQLTASIAHEVNQPLAAAILGAEIARRWLAREPPDLEEAGLAIGGIVRDGKRAADIVGRIRALVKKAPGRRDDLDINEAISEVIGLARSEISKNGVALQTRLAKALPMIQGDRVQLQQVMLNLIMNAVEAMSQTSAERRELLITTQAEADCVLVVVRDSGPGLDEIGTERAFEAFYTTKPNGLGMGLSICRSIIEAHGGRLWASANVPKGAAFQFTVPVILDRQGR